LIDNNILTDKKALANAIGPDAVVYGARVVVVAGVSVTNVNSYRILN
jgi:hypothetical protein